MIKVVIPIGPEHIRSIVQVHNAHYPDHVLTISEQRLQASDGMEICLSDLSASDTGEDAVEYSRFLMGVTASVINYLSLTQ